MAVKAPTIRLGSIDEEFLDRASDLARLLTITEAEVSRLVRAAVLVRVPDPHHRKTFLYPCFENVTRFVEHHRSKRAAINEEFLRAKAGRERAVQLRVEMENRKQAGELVDKAKLIARVEPIIVAYRQQMLSRADRLERNLAQTKSRKEKLRKIRAADLDALGVLSDLFKAAGQTSSNGAKEKTSCGFGTRYGCGSFCRIIASVPAAAFCRSNPVVRKCSLVIT